MGLFHISSSSGNHTCPVPSPITEGTTSPVFGSTTFYELNKIISGSCAVFCCLVVGILLCIHASHMSKPVEQIKIMRMCLIVPFYSIFSFISICFPSAYVFINPWLDVVQGVCLANFFLLLCDYISIDPRQREAFFASINLPADKKTGEPVDGVVWYQKTWFMVIQYPIVSLIAAVATAITQAAHIYCLGSNEPYFAQLWISIITYLSVAVAVMRVLKFFLNLKPYLKGLNPMMKFLAFKLIVLVTFVISILFMILRSTNVLQPSSTLTWADVNIGLQTMITSILMVPFSLFFHYAYRISPYLLHKNPTRVEGGKYEPITPTRYEGGIFSLKTWASLFSLPDLVRGISGRQSVFPNINEGEELRNGDTFYYGRS